MSANQSDIDFINKVAQIAKYDNENIKGFFGLYRFLSNYQQVPILYEGLVYGSTEAAYQAAKTFIVSEKINMTTLTPSESKKYGQTVTMRSDWGDIKDKVMYDICLFKFSHHKWLQKELLATGLRYLEETNWWKDEYWGVCESYGRNKLGHILMAIRKDLNNVENYS